MTVCAETEGFSSTFVKAHVAVLLVGRQWIHSNTDGPLYYYLVLKDKFRSFLLPVVMQTSRYTHKSYWSLIHSGHTGHKNIFSQGNFKVRDPRSIQNMFWCYSTLVLFLREAQVIGNKMFDKTQSRCVKKKDPPLSAKWTCWSRSHT